MAYNFLVVDDSMIVRKMLIKTMHLIELDIQQIHEANNGQEAIDVLDANWVDLVFLDINMPVMNGIEFMTRIREMDEHRATPVIVVSTEGSLDRKRELFEKGVKAFLRKPVTPEELTATITRVIEEESI